MHIWDYKEKKQKPQLVLRRRMSMASHVENIYCMCAKSRIRSLTIEVFMSNMMLCMRNSNVGVGIQNVKMKMIHAIIHIQEKKKDPNHYTNL